PSEVGLYQDDFSDEKSVLVDTKRKTSFLLFFASTGGLRLPHVQTYIDENLFILIFYGPFSCKCNKRYKY
ncbi:hypothetical protein, partial [Oribacterium sinus]